MSLENGILGFLSIKSFSGYDIKKLFDMSADYFWPADQTQIYKTLKKLTKDGLVELKEQKKGETVDRKVYAITDKGQAAHLTAAAESSVSDFISRDMFLMRLFFSGALNKDERLLFLDKQLGDINTLKRKLITNYNENIEHFLNMTGLSADDSRVGSAVWTHKWGLVKCREYAKLIKQIKTEIQKSGR